MIYTKNKQSCALFSIVKDKIKNSLNIYAIPYFVAKKKIFEQISIDMIIFIFLKEIFGRQKWTLY